MDATTAMLRVLNHRPYNPQRCLQDERKGAFWVIHANLLSIYDVRILIVSYYINF